MKIRLFVLLATSSVAFLMKKNLIAAEPAESPD